MRSRNATFGRLWQCRRYEHECSSAVLHVDELWYWQNWVTFNCVSWVSERTAIYKQWSWREITSTILFVDLYSVLWCYLIFPTAWYFKKYATQNAPKRYFYTKYLQKFYGEGAKPPPQAQFPVRGGGAPPPHILSPRVLRPLPQLWKRGCTPCSKSLISFRRG